MPYASLLAFGTGFLALSLEILWVRLFSFANFSLPQAFSFVLIWYLVGIGLGAQMGKLFCRPQFNLWRVSGTILIFSALTSILSPYLYAESFGVINQRSSAGIFITITAFSLALLFPIAHHLGVSDTNQKLGRQLSKVYVANICGATLGPILTGMGLLNLFTTQQCFILCSCCAFLMGLVCLIGAVNYIFLTCTSLSAILVLNNFLFFQPHWLIKQIAVEKNSLKQVIETAQGIIALYRGGKGGDAVFGGNVYDGRTNLDPKINSNRINRLLVLAALQDKPRRVLMIGLSIGTWLKLVTGFKGVKRIDVIEINPGYLAAIKHYPRQYSALSDKRVHIYIDDGRRWLKHHATTRYDLIISNTTFYWRAYSSQLLSYDCLLEIKNHLQPHGILAFNTTSSLDAAFTASKVFQHAYLYDNFIIASDFDWRPKLTSALAYKILSQLSLDNHKLFKKNTTFLIHQFLHEPVRSIPELEKWAATFDLHGELITDTNLITEYKHGRTLDTF